MNQNYVISVVMGTHFQLATLHVHHVQPFQAAIIVQAFQHA
jgi:hypothetical protein